MCQKHTNADQYATANGDASLPNFDPRALGRLVDVVILFGAPAP